MPTPEIWSDMDDVLKQDVVERHSLFQLKHFVVGREYTTQGKMWQCLKEIRTRKSAVEAHLSEIEEAKDRIALLHIEKDRNSLALGDLLKNERNETIRNLAKSEFEIKSRMIDRKIGAMREAVAGLEKKIDDYEAEARFFVAEFRYLNEREPLKPLDDLDAQKEYWTAKLFQEVNIKMLLQQPLDTEVVKTVLSLNDDSPLKQSMIKLLEANHRMIENAANKKPLTEDN